MEGLGAVYKRTMESGKFENFTKMKIVPIFVVFSFIGVLVIISVRTKTTKGTYFKELLIIICFNL